jgi:hypothetical protein
MCDNCDGSFSIFENGIQHSFAGVPISVCGTCIEFSGLDLDHIFQICFDKIVEPSLPSKPFHKPPVPAPAPAPAPAAAECAICLEVIAGGIVKCSGCTATICTECLNRLPGSSDGRKKCPVSITHYLIAPSAAAVPAAAAAPPKKWLVPLGSRSSGTSSSSSSKPSKESNGSWSDWAWEFFSSGDCDSYDSKPKRKADFRKEVAAPAPKKQRKNYDDEDAKNIEDMIVTMMEYGVKQLDKELLHQQSILGKGLFKEFMASLVPGLKLLGRIHPQKIARIRLAITKHISDYSNFF